MVKGINREICPLCNKRKANSRHHLIPKSLGGTDKEKNKKRICRKCHHEFLHIAFNNKELKNTYNTIEKIRNSHDFQMFLIGQWKPIYRKHDNNYGGGYSHHHEAWLKNHGNVLKRVQKHPKMLKIYNLMCSG